jgi:hypothetical protein
MEEDDTLDLPSTFLREMLSEKKSRMRLTESAIITLKGWMGRSILMKI